MHNALNKTSLRVTETENSICTVFGVFSNIFSRRTTGFHKQANLFELNFFIRKTFH